MKQTCLQHAPDTWNRSTLPDWRNYQFIRWNGTVGAMHLLEMICPFATISPQNASPLRGLFRISSMGLVTADLKPVPIEPIDLERGPGFAGAVSKVPKYDCKARLSLRSCHCERNGVE